MTAQEIIKILGLQPHQAEGGYFVETYRAAEQVGDHSVSTAIYYLLTPDNFSEFHRLPTDEVFHFYMGDAVEMWQLKPDGTGHSVLLGTDLERGMRPQVIVPAGTWQASQLMVGGQYALLGTTMAPGFEFADYESGQRGALLAMYPQFREQIMALTRGED